MNYQVRQVILILSFYMNIVVDHILWLFSPKKMLSWCLFFEKEMTTHSSILAWRTSWIEEPPGLPSMGSHRVRHDWSDLACMHALEREMATHSSILAWRIPGTKEPGGPLSMGSQKVGHDWNDLAAAAALVNHLQYWNQIDYILCSQRWRSSIQSVKTRPEADCGSDHEFLIAKFRLKLNKVGKTTRWFRYDLNQIS